MATDTVVRARVSGQVKAEAAGVLAGMGLSIGDAIRMTLARIAAEKTLPFEAKVPNATTEAALRASDRDEGVTRCADADDMLRKLGL